MAMAMAMSMSMSMSMYMRIHEQEIYMHYKHCFHMRIPKTEETHVQTRKKLTIECLVVVSCVSWTQNPKSAILTAPLVLIKILSDLMSRCMRPMLCR